LMAIRSSVTVESFEEHYAFAFDSPRML